MSTGPLSSTPTSPAAQLRQALVSYFNPAELKAICFDLGLDYDSLPAEAGQSGRAIEIIAHFAERGQIAALVDRIASERPNVDWATLRTAALNPSQFKAGQSFAIVAPTTRANTSAMRFGALIGALAVLLVVCGFGGGLAAGKVVDVTLKPVPYDRQAGTEALKKLISLNEPITPGGLKERSTGFTNVEATSLATDIFTAIANPPISDPHIRFTDTGTAILNMRVNSLRSRRVVIAYTVYSSGGSVYIRPESAWLNVVEIENSKFGWVPLPTSAVEPVTGFLQSLADRATAHFIVSKLTIADNDLSISGQAR